MSGVLRCFKKPFTGAGRVNAVFVFQRIYKIIQLAGVAYGAANPADGGEGLAFEFGDFHELLLDGAFDFVAFELIGEKQAHMLGKQA